MSLSYHYQRSVCDTAMCEPNITNRGKWGKEHCTVDTLLLLLLFWVLVCLFWQSNTAQTDLKFLFLLPLPPKSWGTKLRCIYYSPLTIYESELPHLSFPKKHLSQGHYRTSHTVYHTKTNLQSNYNAKEITSLWRNNIVQTQVINTHSSFP